MELKPRFLGEKKKQNTVLFIYLLSFGKSKGL